MLCGLLPITITGLREVSAADLASDLASEGVSEPLWSPRTGATMGEAAALLVLSGDADDQGEL